MKISVARVFGPDCANASVPTRFFCCGGSSTIKRLRHDGVNVVIAMHAELHDELGNHAEETPFREVAHADQLVEPVHAVRRPGTRCFHDHVPF